MAVGGHGDATRADVEGRSILHEHITRAGQRADRSGAPAVEGDGTAVGVLHEVGAGPVRVVCGDLETAALVGEGAGESGAAATELEDAGIGMAEGGGGHSGEIGNTSRDDSIGDRTIGAEHTTACTHLDVAGKVDVEVLVHNATAIEDDGVGCVAEI